jgi:acetolactate synthase I/II/III large subunit
MLGKSKRPLVYAGGGVINANGAKELREFCETFNLPVVTTLMGIGAFDTTTDRSLHMLGMHGTAYANYAVEDCDFLIAVGSRFDDRVAGKVDTNSRRTCQRTSRTSTSTPPKSARSKR